MIPPGSNSALCVCSVCLSRLPSSAALLVIAAYGLPPSSANVLVCCGSGCAYMVKSGPWAVARTTPAVVSLLVVMMSAGNAWVVVNSYAPNAAIAASSVAGSSELIRTYKARLQLR